MITSTSILSTSPFETTIPAKPMSTIPLVPLNTADRTGDAAKSSDPTVGHGLEEINWSQVNVSNNNLDMHLMAGPEQVRQELPKEISMYPFPKCYNHYLTQKYSEYIKFVL
jgi:hypothetical protein